MLTAVHGWPPELKAMRGVSTMHSTPTNSVRSLGKGNEKKDNEGRNEKN